MCEHTEAKVGTGKAEQIQAEDTKGELTEAELDMFDEDDLDETQITAIKDPSIDVSYQIMSVMKSESYMYINSQARS